MRNIEYNILGLLKCMALLAFTICVGCNDEYNPSNGNSPSVSFHYLKPSSTSFTFGSDEPTKSLQITSEGVEWAIQHSASWLTVSPSSGSTTTNVKLSAEQHLSGDTSRMAIMNLASTLTDWEYDRAISVSQSAATPYLTPSVNSQTFSGTASSIEIDISSNSVWAVVCNYDWLRATKLSERTLQVSVDENPTNDFRSGTILLSNKSGEKRVEVTQYASGVSVSQTSIQTEKDAALFTLTIESEIGWTANSSADWIQVSPAKGDAGTSNIEISTTENNMIDLRKGYVYIYTDTYQKAQIAIIQKGLYLEVTQESLTFTSDTESQQITIQSNTHWVVKEAPDWLTLSATLGEGTQTLEVTSTENNSTMPRSGSIVFAHDFLDLKHEVAVSQEAKIFNASKSVLEFGVKASTQSIDIISGLPWLSSVSDDWISTNVTQGKGNTTVEVSVTETQSYDERFGTIDYSVVDKNITVNVHQLAKYFTITDKSFRFGSKGGNTNLSFSANEAWTIQIADSVEWVTLSQTVGEGNGNVKITVTDNPSLESRETTLSIKTSVGQTINIMVKQDARFLKTDATSFSYFAAGGEGSFTINTDGTYKVESSEEWITLRNQSTNTWLILVAKNTEAVIRQGVVTIQLTDLVKGEKVISIPITQTYEGGIYIDRAFEEEVKWDVTKNEGFAISIKSYSTDDTWDSKNKDSIVIMKSEYSSDELYDSLEKDTTDVNKSDFSGDNGFDSTDRDSTNVNKSDYSNEQDWN